MILIITGLISLTFTASVKRRHLNNSEEAELFGDDDENDSGNNNANDKDNAEPEELPIASIKSRAIAMDRELCRELSRHHPHHPRCHLYCVQLKHWMGMCRRDSCHCYS